MAHVIPATNKMPGGSDSPTDGWVDLGQFWPQTEAHLGYAAGQLSETYQKVHHWMDYEKQIKGF